MNWMFNRCAGRRQDISLLAADLLPSHEKSALESHLAACPICAKYYRQVLDAAKPLEDWESKIPPIEPTTAMQARWEKAILSAAAAVAKSPRQSAKSHASAGWWREVIWPYRHAWTGMAALWLVLWLVDSRMTASPSMPGEAHQRLSPAMMQAIIQDRRELTELMPPMDNTPVPAAQPVSPRPRSEIRSAVAVA